MGLLSGIGKAIGGVGKALGGIGNMFKGLSGILNSPLGQLFKMAFPPLAMMQPFMNFGAMMGGLSGGIGGGSNY